MKKLILLSAFVIFFVSLSFGQTYYMSANPITTCDGTYYDPGGTGDYGNSVSITQTFTPGTAGQMLQFAFSSFSTESGYDYLYIYDGPDNTYPLIGEYDGNTSPGTITATQTGQLTFYFYSDGGVVSSGWQATISCVVPPNNALDFRGGDYVKVNTGSASLLGTFTVECWAQVSSNEDVYAICGSRYSGDQSFDMKFDNGKIHGDIGDGSSWLTTAADVTYAYSADTWYHIAYVVTPTSWTVYVHNTSGTLVAYNTGTYSGTPLLFDANHTLAIGDRSIDETSEYLEGKIDEFRVWSRALSQQEIQNSMFSETCSVASGLVLCYHFNQGISCGDNYEMPLIDAGPNNYNGTMYYFYLNGDCTDNWCDGVSAITVNACPAAYKAQFVSMNLGSNSWCAGETRSVTVTVKNVGTATWTNGSPEINIGCKWNADADFYVRCDANNLAPGSTATYSLTMTAPSASGSNNLTFSAVYENCFWFHDNPGSINCTYGATTCSGNSAYVSGTQTIKPLPTNVSAGTDATICSGSSTQLQGSATGPTISSSTSATFTHGDNSTEFNSSPSTSTNSSCPVNLSVDIPVGATITGVDVSYKMTASSTNNAYMSEQRSYLECTSPGGSKETSIYNGSDNSSGQFSYSRTNLTIANGVTGGGTINFRLHAFRTWGSSGSGCNAGYNKVDNNTFEITVYYTYQTVTYSWSPATGLSTTNIANPTASPASTTTYTMTASAGGCSVEDAVTITANPLEPGAISANQTICNNTTPAQFTGDEASGGIGSFTYQWQTATSPTGPWSNIVGATASSYTETSPLTANTYYRRMAVNQCGTVYSTEEAPASGNLKLNYTFDDPQEPTTNLLPYATAICGSGGMAGYWSGTITPNNYEKTYNSYKVTTLNDGYYNGFISSSGGSCTNGVTYTFSLKAWIPSGKQISFRMRNCTTGGSIAGSDIPINGNDNWQYVSKSFTADAQTCGNIEGVQNNGTAADVFSFYVRDLQLEQKDHATQFVNNTRPTATVTDYSPNNNNGTIALATSPVWTSNGVNGGAYSFDGTSSYIDLGNTLDDDILAAVPASIACWVKGSFTSGNGNEIIFGHYVSKIGLGIYPSGGNNSFIVTVGGSGQSKPTFACGNSWVDDAWNHIVVTYDASLNSTFWLNGEQIPASGASNYWTWNSNVSTIGKRPQGDHFKGTIDDFRIYNTKLSESDVATLYNNSVALHVTVNPIVADVTPGNNNYVWSGAAGTTTWEEAGNWVKYTSGTPGTYSTVSNMPSASDNVFITTGTCIDQQPTATSAGAVCNNLTVTSTGALTINDGKKLTVNGSLTNDGTITSGTGTGSIDIKGNWTNNGTFNSGSGKVTFLGTDNTITSDPAKGTFYNIDVGSTGNFTMNSDITLTNTFQFGYEPNTPTMNGLGGHTLTAKDCYIDGYFNLTNVNDKVLSSSNSGYIDIGMYCADEFVPIVTISNGTIKWSSNDINIGALKQGKLIQTGGDIIIENASGSLTADINAVYEMTGGMLTIPKMVIANWGTPATVNFFNNTTTAINIGEMIIGPGDGVNKGIVSCAGYSPIINFAGNWTNNGTYTAGNGTVIFNDTTQQTVYAGTSNFNNLILNNASGIKMTSDLTVGNVLNMTSGNIETGVNTLELGTSASSIGSLSYTDGFVLGKMKRWFPNVPNSGKDSSLFPLGVESNNRHLLVEYTSASSGGSLTAFFNETSMGWPETWMELDQMLVIPAEGECAQFIVTTLSDEGYWDITPSGMTGGLYNISLTGGGIQTINNLCNITALKRVGTAPWGQSGTHIQPVMVGGNPVVKREGASGWSNWGMGGGAYNPLPINLLTFNAVCQNKEVTINWSTATETNNDYFTIERSIDAQKWDVLTQIEGAGNSNEVKYYTVRDDNPYNGISYYRLKQTDYNGQYEYFNPVSVHCNSDETLPNITYYPNPFTSELFVDIQNIVNTNASLIIYDLLGNKVYENDIRIEDELNYKITLDLKNLNTGVYMVNFISDEYSNTVRIVKN